MGMVVVFDESPRVLLEIAATLNAHGIEEVLMVQNTAATGKLLCPDTDKVCASCGEYKDVDQQPIHICKGLRTRDIIHPRFQCKICKKEGFTFSSLAHHHEKVHKTKEFTCLECLDAFDCSSALGKHRAQHKKDREETSRDRKYLFFQSQVAGILKELEPFDREGSPSLVLMTEDCFKMCEGNTLNMQKTDDVPIAVLSNNNTEMSKLLDHDIPVLKMPIEKEDATKIMKYLKNSEGIPNI